MKTGSTARYLSTAIVGLLAAHAADASPKSRHKAKDACHGMTPVECVKAAFPFEYGIDVDGTHVKQDSSRAAAMYRSACAAKDADGCAFLGNMRSDAGLDAKAALKFLRMACRLDDKHCYVFALELRHEDDDASRDEAMKLFGTLCDDKRPLIAVATKPAEACFMVGDMLENSYGPAEQRANWFRRACNGGFEKGCEHLVLALGENSDPSALREMEDLCTKGHAAACGGAGARYFEMQTTRSAAFAAQQPWFIKGCALGAAWQCTEAGTFKLDSGTTDAERADGVRMLKKACSAGDERACGRIPSAQK
jgi:TPR repeat protein